MNLPTSSFDRAVWGIIATLILLVVVVSWVGTQPISATTGDTLLRIVYSAVDASGHEHLYSIFAQTDAVEPAPVQLTANEQGLWGFRVAPQGNDSPSSGGIIFTVPNLDSTSDFWQVTRGGEQPRFLLECPRASCTTPTLSPDGRFLAYTRRSTATVETTGGLSPPRIWLLNLESGETVQVIADSQALGFDPHWSANSQWLSYLSPDPAAVGVYNLNDGRHFIFETRTGESGIWHPDRELFLTSELAQIGEQFVVHLKLIDPNGNTITNLSGDDALVEDNSAAWSPDGARIAFRRKELTGPRASNGKQLWLMRADDSDARPLTEDAAFDHGQPAWSPDGTQLLYHRFPLKGPNIVLSIWVMDVESGEVREVVSPGQRPQWWP